MNIGYVILLLCIIMFSLYFLVRTKEKILKHLIKGYFPFEKDILKIRANNKLIGKLTLKHSKI